MSDKSERERVTNFDFFVGLVCTLARHYGYHQYLPHPRKSYEELHQRFAQAFQELLQRAFKQKLDVRFVIVLHPLHGDSREITDGIAHLICSGLLVQEVPEGSLRFTQWASQMSLAHIPGSDELWDGLAEVFWEDLVVRVARAET